VKAWQQSARKPHCAEGPNLIAMKCRAATFSREESAIEARIVRCDNVSTDEVN
jgi:hypothetical protein